jgi:hypothetical protein
MGLLRHWQLPEGKPRAALKSRLFFPYVSSQNLKEKDVLEDSRIWADNINMDVKGIGREDMDFIHLV